MELYEAKLIPRTALPETIRDDPSNMANSDVNMHVSLIADDTEQGDETCTTVTSSAHAAEGPASVAAGFLLHFKGKAGMTQTVLTELVEMNQAVVGSVLTNLSSELSDVLARNDVDLASPLATRILEAVERQNDQLDGLQTTYRISKPSIQQL